MSISSQSTQSGMFKFANRSAAPGVARRPPPHPPSGVNPHHSGSITPAIEKVREIPHKIIEKLATKLEESQAHADTFFKTAETELKRHLKSPMEVFATLISSNMQQIEKILIDVVIELAKLKYPQLQYLSNIVTVIKDFIKGLCNFKMNICLSTGTTHVEFPIVDVQAIFAHIQAAGYDVAGLSKTWAPKLWGVVSLHLSGVFSKVSAFFERIYMFIPAKYQETVHNVISNFSGVFSVLKTLISTYLAGTSGADEVSAGIVDMMEPVIQTNPGYVPPPPAPMTGSLGAEMSYDRDPFSDFDHPTQEGGGHKIEYHENPLKAGIGRRFVSPHSFPTTRR